MFERLSVRRVVLEKLVEAGHDYSEHRRRLGYALGPRDQAVIHRVDCQIQDSEPNQASISVQREDVDWLYELRRRLHRFDRSLTSRVFLFYLVASYVLLAPFAVTEAVCFVMFAPLVAWTIPYFLFKSAMLDPLAGSRLIAVAVLGLWVSRWFAASIQVGSLFRWRMFFLLLIWCGTVWLTLTQFDRKWMNGLR